MAILNVMDILKYIWIGQITGWTVIATVDFVFMCFKEYIIWNSLLDMNANQMYDSVLLDRNLFRIIL